MAWQSRCPNCRKPKRRTRGYCAKCAADGDTFPTVNEPGLDDQRAYTCPHCAAAPPQSTCCVCHGRKYVLGMDTLVRVMRNAWARPACECGVCAWLRFQEGRVFRRR